MTRRATVASAVVHVKMSNISIILECIVNFMSKHHNVESGFLINDAFVMEVIQIL